MWQTEDIVRIIEEQGDTIALVYFSGMVVQSHDNHMTVSHLRHITYTPVHVHAAHEGHTSHI